MKVDRSIDSVNVCEPWCYANNTPIGTFIFLKYLYGKNEVLPKMQKNQTPEIKTKIRYRQFKRFRATGC